MLFTINKKINSTKQPDTEAFVLEGALADDFTLTNLVISFATLNPTQAPAYNYARINTFSRYYFITDWAFSGGLWYASLTVDVLATYKTTIGSSLQFVTRSASRFDGGIVDTFPLTKAQTYNRVASSITNNPFNLPTNVNGVVVMGVVNDLGRDGAVTYYMIPLDYFRQFMSSMLSSISWAGISVSEISQELQKALINPTQYIVSCMYFMVDYSVWRASLPTEIVTSIRCGWWSFSVTEALIIPSALGGYGSGALNIPKHPQVGTHGDYVNLSPYSKYTLTFLPFGVFELDTTDLAGKTTLYWSINYSLATGDAILNVSIDNTKDHAILTSQCNIGVQLPVGQIMMNLNNFDQSLMLTAVTGAEKLATMFRQGR